MQESIFLKQVVFFAMWLKLLKDMKYTTVEAA